MVRLSQKLVQGVDLRELVHETFGNQLSLGEEAVERRGIGAALMKDNNRVGTIILGVFADTVSASAVFQDHLDCTSAPPDKNLSGRIGQKAAGWGQTTVLFQRDNVVVALWLREEALEKAAGSLDRALAAGESGVIRGNIVPALRILEVEVPDEVEAGSTVPLKVRISIPRDALGDHIGFGHRMGGTLFPHSAPDEGELTYTLSYPAEGRSEPYEKSYWVCYATPMCVVVSQEVTIKVVPPAKKE